MLESLLGGTKHRQFFKPSALLNKQFGLFECWLKRGGLPPLFLFLESFIIPLDL